MASRFLERKELERFLELVRKGEGLARAARRVGLDPSTVRKARRDNAEFDEMVRAAEAEAAEPVETVLYQAALEGQPWAVTKWLEHRSSERWGPLAHKVEVGVQVGPTPALERILVLQQQLEMRQQALGLAPAPVLDVQPVD